MFGSSVVANLIVCGFMSFWRVRCMRKHVDDMLHFHLVMPLFLEKNDGIFLIEL